MDMEGTGTDTDINPNTTKKKALQVTYSVASSGCLI